MKAITAGLGLLLTTACTQHHDISSAADADRAPMPSQAVERAPAKTFQLARAELDGHIAPTGTTDTPLAAGSADRAYSVALLTRVAGPVLEALSRNELKRRMAVHDWDKQRSAWTHYEAFAHTLAGVAPWIALGPKETPEGRLRGRFAILARQALVNATDPSSPDYLGFGTMRDQPLAESAYLAYAILRAKDQLWEPLDPPQRKRVLDALKTARKIRPNRGDETLHAAMVEAAVWELEGRTDVHFDLIKAVITSPRFRFVGTEAEGAEATLDADYRGYLVQPMLITILQVAERKRNRLAAYLPEALERARRTTASMESRISADGALPVSGPSAAHRFAAYFQLSNGALDGQLDSSVAPSAVRSAVTTAARRMLEPQVFVDDEGWLQPDPTTYGARADEPFYTGGSLYVCLTGLVHLGLPETDPFWSDAPVDWTARRQMTAGGPRSAEPVSH